MRLQQKPRQMTYFLYNYKCIMHSHDLKIKFFFKITSVLNQLWFVNQVLLFIIRKCLDAQLRLVKFIYSEKATEFCKISAVNLTSTTWDKSKVEILQNVAFSIAKSPP